MKECVLQSSNSVKKNDEIKFMNKVEHHKKKSINIYGVFNKHRYVWY